MQPDQRLFFLRLLVEHRDDLFGRKMSSSDRNAKQESWTMVRRLCIADEGFDPLPPGRNWQFMRDKVFMRMKEATKKRLERLNMGGRAAKNVQFSEQDKLVLTVLGYDMSSMTEDDENNLNKLADLSQNGFVVEDTLENEDDEEIASITFDEDLPTSSTALPIFGPSTLQLKAKKRKMSPSTDCNNVVKNFDDLIAEKLQLQVDHLKEQIELSRLQRELIKLDILKRRKELNLPAQNDDKKNDDKKEIKPSPIKVKVEENGESDGN